MPQAPLPPIGAEVPQDLAGLPPVGAEVPQAEEKPTLRALEAQPSALEPVGRAFASFWEQINPLAAVSGLASTAADPIGAIKGVGRAQGELYAKAARAFEEGDYITGARHAVNYLLPLVGPALDVQGDKAASGNVAGSIGGTAGLATAMLAPAKIPGTKIGLPALAKNANALEREAVAFGQARGIPVDAATATGNPVVRGAQWLADRSIGGTRVGQQARQAQAEGFARVGGELAERARPGAAITAEQAGQGVRTAVEARITAFKAEADQAYDALRQIEADPKNTKTVKVGSKTEQTGVLDPQGKPIGRTVDVTESIALPVDMRSVKAQLKPIHDRLTRQMPITLQRASPGFKAIENILGGKDYVSASVADLDLSAIKAISREADNPQLRSLSQGLAAKAVATLDGAVQRAVSLGGPKATAALKAGREATKAKFAAGDLLQQLRTEPVQVFQQAIWRQDAGINRLRDVAKLAPKEMPKIGRAYLEDLMETATAEGAFDKTRGLSAKWQSLGPETKKLLFKDPAHVRDLDHFFLLAKKAAENPNPSGTALVGSLSAQGAYILTEPVSGTLIQIPAYALARLLHSELGVRALTTGMRVTLGNKTAATAVTGQILRLAGEDARPLAPMSAPLPAMAGAEDQR